MGLIQTVLASAVLAGAAVSASAQPIPTIKVAFNAPGDEAKLLMREHPEYFPAIGRDYKIEWLHLQGTATVSQALIVGTADCGISAPLTLAQGIIAAGLQPVLIGATIGESPTSFTSYWAVKEDSPIKTIQDLKGKTVAVNTIGSQLDAFTRMWLKQNGIDPQRGVNIAEIPFPLAETALRQGRVDAIILVQPFASRAEEAGGLRKLGAQRDVQTTLLNLIEVCSKRFVDEHPDAAAQYAKDFASASSRFSSDKEASIKLISKTVKLPEPVLKSFMFTDKDYQRYPDGAIDIDSLQQSFDIFHANGFLDKKLDAKAYIRPQISLTTQPEAQ
ncbi:ABC transporter substrate-binding protein [Pusillimonas sp.]|uniref:ABC transporter substrate-binding protein n=1 Tax=Pusillimonas sp. TaxID=3040095 RepID=UPI0037C92D26